MSSSSQQSGRQGGRQHQLHHHHDDQQHRADHNDDGGGCDDDGGGQHCHQQHQREAQFLESRRERTVERLRRRRRQVDAAAADDDAGKGGGGGGGGCDAIHGFRASVRSHIADWKVRLERLEDDEHDHDRSSKPATSAAAPTESSASQSKLPGQKKAAMSEDEKRDLHLKLEHLKRELLQLRKICLSPSASSSFSSQSQQGIPSSSAAAPPLPLPDTVLLRPTDAEELPPSDLRVLHDELGRCRELLDAARRRLLPGGKFVFRRYRKAVAQERNERIQLKQQQQQAVGAAVDGGGAENVTGATSGCDDEAGLGAYQENDDNDNRSRFKPKNCVEDLAGVRAVIDRDGVVVDAIRGGGGDGNSQHRHQQRAPEDGGDSAEEGNDAPSSPVVVRNVRNSSVELQGDAYKSVHLVGISRSTVVVGGAVEGAIHVTSCRHVTLRLLKTCQQLRIHESSDVQVEVAAAAGGGGCCVTAGAILEDCRRILFVVERRSGSSSDSQEDAAELDVKDFNWLKKGVASPNYAIEWTTGADRDHPRNEGEAGSERIAGATKATVTTDTAEGKQCSVGTDYCCSTSRGNDQVLPKGEIATAPAAADDDDDEL